ncbi:tRNA (adenosine(37)-N6)-threonylcarbamoyltransferase complex dimerization subunit type 1 TsaB [Frigidibacter oleivorans]|uniref:tRNA (adenosine(37)-N6)-threonylcarbamoyltransferase complex dimerization subunit type 1 TsaB n=1 Tax=Frigidibacter oleivorans TaxID=2487129 RepID=UPI000F8E0D75|nr:tRNA (adenosine(37)-N6)-threonylcarbamoyltransferase complex dimerization subunit type 1 TsaB [Frigidibacter oleivorans]
MPDRYVLAFDTSAAHCAAALLCGDRPVEARREEMAKGQAERLMPLLAETLAAAGIGWRDLSGIGVGIGPGNFTGIRIAVAAARGLALALGIPAAGIGTLEALAEGLPGPLVALEDARREELYAQGFGTGPAEPRMLPLAELAQTLPAGMAVTGGAAGLLLAVRPDLRLLPPALPLAEAMARIAARRIGQGAVPRPAPLYLRMADAAPAADPPPRILP